MFTNSEDHKRKSRRIFLWLAPLITILVSLACLLTTGLFDRSPIADLSRNQSGLIAYVGVDGNIYTIDKEGGNQRQVTSDAQMSADSGGEERFYQSLTWSPDGQNLAFVGTTRSAGKTQDVSLYTAFPRKDDLTEVYNSSDRIPFYLYWGPDSEQLTFLSSGDQENELILQIVPARGGEVQVLGTGQPYYWVWSPDNERIFTHTGGATALRPDAQLSFLDLEKVNKEDKLDLRPANFQAPDWSSNGDELLFSAETDDGQGGLFLGDQQGAVIRIIVVSEGAVAFSWSPDGEKIAYLADSNPTPQILSSPLTIIDRDKPEGTITTIDEQVIAFFWSPDSRRIAYFVPVIDAPGDELVQTGESDPVLQLSLRVLLLETGAAQEVACYVPTTQFLNLIPFFDQYQRSDTIWSPDSKSLVYSSLDADGKSGIFVVEAAGGKSSTRVADGQLAFWSWK